MTRYRFPKLEWRDVWKVANLERFRSVQLRNHARELRGIIEANDGGFVYMGVNFLMVAGDDHVHLQSKETLPDAGVFDSGLEVSIGNRDFRCKKGPKLKAFEYESKPVIRSAEGRLRSGSECLVELADGLSIDGNTLALLSLAEHCFDLAETATVPGSELVYMPGSQLEHESMSLVLRRI